MRVLPASGTTNTDPRSQGGEQLQMVGILRNAANDVRGELPEQQRLVGGGGRVGGGEVDRAAVGQPGQRGGVGGIAVGEGVVADCAVGSIQADLAPVAQASSPGQNSWFVRRVGDSRRGTDLSSRGAGAGMNRTVSRVVVLAGVSAGVLAVRRMTTRQVGDGTARVAPDRWHTVTVNRPPEVVAPDGQLPEPLAGLGDAVEVQVRPAPGGRGTELAARPRTSTPSGLRGVVARAAGSDPRQAVRTALRQAKQLAETGEVLEPDKPPTTRRTLRNLPLELATRRARGEGRL